MRIDALFAGVFIGYLYHFCRHWFDKLTGRHALPLCALCVAPAFVFPAESWPMRTYGLSLLMIGFTFLVAWSVAREPRGFIARFAAKIGFYSYSIYLWHPCLAFPFGALFRDSTLAFWIALPLAIAIGVTMSELVEIPVLRFRERWGFTKAKTETAIPSPVSNSAARDVVFLPAEPSLLS